MTAPDTTIAQPSEEQLTKLVEAIKQGAEQQPTLHLLDVEQAEWYSADGDLHEVSFGDVDGYMDVAASRFIPDDPEQVRLLLVAELQAAHGETPFDVGGQQRAIDWNTVQILAEDGGVIRATADSADGAATAVPLTIDLDWQVTVGPAEADLAAETGITAEYLGDYYGGDLFQFDGRDFVIDWSTWKPDQTGDDGLVGSEVEASSDGVKYNAYAWFDPASGPAIVRAEPADADADATDDEDAGHGITAQYLGDYYGADPLEFEGMNYVVDWTTWKPDQITDDGRYGSEVTGLGSDGADYELYVWFDLEDGAQIVRATAAEADAAEDEAGDEDIADPQAHFDEVLSQQLRDRWASNGSRLLDGSTEYDVSAWVNGEYGGEIDFTGHDGKFFYATLTATTGENGSKRVKCSLRIKDADDVVVESEEVLS